MQYVPATGELLRPEACNQRFHVEWGNYQPESKVLSFHCGIFDCPDNEKWDLYQDGTIHPRKHPHLAIGMTPRPEGPRTVLVPEGDTRKIVFTHLAGVRR